MCSSWTSWRLSTCNIADMQIAQTGQKLLLVPLLILIFLILTLKHTHTHAHRNTHSPFSSRWTSNHKKITGVSGVIIELHIFLPSASIMSHITDQTASWETPASERAGGMMTERHRERERERERERWRYLDGEGVFRGCGVTCNLKCLAGQVRPCWGMRPKDYNYFREKEYSFQQIYLMVIHKCIPPLSIWWRPAEVWYDLFQYWRAPMTSVPMSAHAGLSFVS